VRSGPGSAQRKSIYDPVHGSLTLDGAPLELIGHPAFQRLWAIRQTGFVHLVFPGANHTRLEHSLGTYWVTREMSARLALDPDESATVAAGGLLHDLGHGPFSHSLDGPMREVLGSGHERLSRQWIVADGPSESRWRARESRPIPDILERHGLRPKAVASLVDPPPGSGRAEILGAMLHGAIDADRIDYLQRDAHYTGVAHGAVDAARLLDTVSAEDGQLVFAEKGRHAVEGFLVGRATMYGSVYYHKTVRAAEVMVQAAVERMTGYPDGCRELLYGTDGELLRALQDGGTASARLVQGLEIRGLHKRAGGLRSADGAVRRTLRQWDAEPAARRSAEDELAHGLGGKEGDVLLDLAGLELRVGWGRDWNDVAIREDGRLTYPFRKPGPWSELARRPPTAWAVAVYVAPRLRQTAERRLVSLLRRVT